MQTIDSKRRPRREPFGQAAIKRLIEPLQAQAALDFLDIVRQPGNRLAFELCQPLHVLIEALNGHLAPLILHCCQQMYQRPERVRRYAAPVAGMQIAVSAARSQLESEHAAYTENDERAAAFVDRAIAGDDKIRHQFLAVSLDKGLHLRTTNLLFAFK